MQDKEQHSLRYGYSTGACMTALCLGLWKNYCTGEKPNHIEILFLDQQKKELPLIIDELDNGILKIQKDGGDDPDCTHLAILSASFCESTLSQAQKEDYILSIGKNTLILHADSGIGVCTRKGLDCDEGKWAINKKPRQMLIENLELHHFGTYQNNNTTVFQLTISVENGKELAKKTLNSKLGIIGGISILGTTGHVRPFSHDAYKATIRICTNTVKLENGTHIVFSTGGRSLNSAKKYYPHLAESAFISIADFIGFSIETAQKFAIKEVSIACMAGKLCKYAAKQFYTHAHKEEQDLTLLKNEIACAIQQLSEQEILDSSWQNAQSVREALCSFTENGQKQILNNLAEKALLFFKSLYPHGIFHILICDFDGTILMVKHGE